MQPNFQLSSASACGLPGFSTLFLFPSLRLQATGSPSVLLRPCLAAEGAVNPALSQELCSRAGQHWAWGYSRPGLWHWNQGPYCPEAISVPSDFSMPSTIFGLQSSYMLGYCWTFALFLRRSTKGFTSVQGEVDSAPTYLATIFSPSYLTLMWRENPYLLHGVIMRNK